MSLSWRCVSRKIAGYRLGERLGQGSTGAVYLARDERLHYQVAVKVLAPDPARDIADTLIHEVRTAAALEHPHIIPVFDAGDEDGTPYVVMRYARGGDARKGAAVAPQRAGRGQSPAHGDLAEKRRRCE